MKLEALEFFLDLMSTVINNFTESTTGLAIGY